MKQGYFNISLTICLICFFFLTSVVMAGDINGKVVTNVLKLLQNTVIYIDKIPGKEFTPPKDPVVMDQSNMKFMPHVLPILKGTTVDFLNSDAVLHNVFTPDKVADKFNLGSWPQGKKRSYTFKNPGVAVMLCKVHPEMEAWVVILETPYFAVSDKEGNFTIPNVPQGEYVLKVWNEKLKGNDQKISVPSEGGVTVDISLKR